MDRRLAAAIAAVVVAFGGGFLFAKGVDGKLFTPAGAAQAIAYWPFFGHPRAANAPRAGEIKPDGFAIWKTRLDTSSADPLACIEMTRDLDPVEILRRLRAGLARPRPRAGGHREGRHPLRRRRRLHRPPDHPAEGPAFQGRRDAGRQRRRRRSPTATSRPTSASPARASSCRARIATGSASRPSTSRKLLRRGLARRRPQPGAQVDQRARSDPRGPVRRRLRRRQPRRRGPDGLEGLRAGEGRPRRTTRPRSSRSAPC